MSEASFISVKTLDAAFEQVTTTPSLDGLTAAGIVGYKHGLRMLRQRIGRQFLRNQGHYITPQQLDECVSVLTGEVNDQKAPTLDPIADVVRRSPEYWKGYGQGVVGYRSAIEKAREPVAAPPAPRRRTP